MEFSDTPEAVAAPEEAVRRRGRPRSQETLERDIRVLTALGKETKSKDQLVEELDLKPELVYLSLWRLKRDERVERVNDTGVRHAWRAR